LLSGQRPHQAEGYNAILFHILTQPPEPLARLRQDLPVGLAEVVANAMAFDRMDRYPEVKGLAEALHPFAVRERSVPSAAKTPSPNVPPAPTLPEAPSEVGEAATPVKHPRRGKAVWFIGLALAFMVGGVLFRQIRRKEPVASPPLKNPSEKFAPTVAPAFPPAPTTKLPRLQICRHDRTHSHRKKSAVSSAGLEFDLNNPYQK
jgi:hypothetical protein